MSDQDNIVDSSKEIAEILAAIKELSAEIEALKEWKKKTEFLVWNK